MKDKFITVPLWIADILMFVAVFAICREDAEFGERMSEAKTIGCIVLVVLALALIALPLIFSHRENLAKIRDGAGKDKSDSENNFRLIFDDLTSLRSLCADIDERLERDENAIEKLALITNKDSPISKSVSALEKSVAELNDSADSTAKASDTALSEIKQIRETIKKLAEDISISVKSAEASHAEAVASKAEAEAANKKFELVNSRSDSGEKLLFELKKNSDTKFAELAARLGEIESSMKALENKSSKPEPSAMLLKALSNAGAGNGDTVKKFISKVPICPSKSETVFDSEGDILNNPEGVQNDNPDLSKNTPATENKVSSEDSENKVEPENVLPSDEKPEDKKSTDLSDNSGKIEEGTLTSKGDDADFFDSAGSDENVSEPEKKISNIDKTSLFSRFSDIFGQASKKETVVTLNTIIGIGNKPYLRGSGGGLFPNKGIQMDFVEIGKWRWIAPEGSGNIKFTILKNDKTPAINGDDFQISEGESLDLSLIFPPDASQ